MFERFTELARQVVVLAQDEARAFKHNYIGTEHLLLGLLREEDGIAAQVLGSLDVTIEEVRAQVARIVGPGEEVATGQIPFTPRAKKVLELALREALALGHNYIGTEHILLGIAREDNGVAARILLDSSVDAEKIRNEVIRLLSTHGRREPSSPGPGWTPYARARRRTARPSWSKLSEARDEALEEGEYDLARKLLELEIEARQKRRRGRIDVSASQPEVSMRTITLIHHRVEDFDAWKQVYDGFAGAQREGGVRWQHVWRDRDDPSMVVVIHMFDGPDAAKAFFDRPDLKEAMGSGGVDTSSLRIEFLDEVGGGAP